MRTSRDRLRIGLTAVVLVLAYIAWSWTAPLPLVTSAVVFGLVTALIAKGDREAALLGGFIGLVGSALALYIIVNFQVPEGIDGAGSWARHDILPSFYEYLVTAVFGRPDLRLAALMPPAAWLVSGVVSGAFAYLGRYLARRVSPLSVVIPLFIVMALVIMVGAPSISRGYDRFEKIVEFDATGHDAYQYARVYAKMRAGAAYYPTMINLKRDDFAAEGIDLEKQFRSGGANYRAPYIFYLWRVLAPTVKHIGYLAIAAAIGILALVFAAGFRKSPALAALAGVLLTPYLLMAISWENIFLPTFWAMLLVLAACAAVLLDRPWPAVAALLVAGLFRELALLAVLVFGLAYLLKGDRRVAGAIGIAGAVILAAFWWHNQVIVAELGGVPLRQLGFSMTPLVNSFLAGSAYLMFPYGAFKFHPALFVLPLGIAGALLAPSRELRLALPAYLGLWVLLNLFFYSSSYWGQLYLAPALLGVAFLVDSLGSQPDPAAT